MKERVRIYNNLGNINVYLKDRIIPERYVWHVSTSYEEWGIQFKKISHHYKMFKNDYIPYVRKKIAREGLRFRGSNAVFAHNGKIPVCQMHPIRLDLKEQMEALNYDSEGDYRFLRDYTFWRIDTWATDVPWFVDGFMTAGDRCQIDGKPDGSQYILTTKEIPPHALTCFEYRLTSKRKLYEYRPLPKERQENPWDYIRPVYEINNLIFHAAEQAA